MCQVCGHSYTYHYCNQALFEREYIVQEYIADDMKDKYGKARSDEERVKMLYRCLEIELLKSIAKRQQLSEKLFKDIAEFEALGVTRNYAKLIENQLALIESHLEGIVAPDKDDLRTTRDELVKRLEVIRAT